MRLGETRGSKAQAVSCSGREILYCTLQGYIKENEIGSYPCLPLAQVRPKPLGNDMMTAKRLFTLEQASRAFGWNLLLRSCRR